MMIDHTTTISFCASVATPSPLPPLRLRRSPVSIERQPSGVSVRRPGESDPLGRFFLNPVLRFLEMVRVVRAKANILHAHARTRARVILISCSDILLLLNIKTPRHHGHENHFGNLRSDMRTDGARTTRTKPTSKENHMSIQHLKEIYNPMAKKEYKPKSWKEFESITNLHEFLTVNKGMGFQLRQRHGDPIMRFEPGLKRDNQIRWALAEKAEAMLFAAAADLRTCIELGIIPIPEAECLEEQSRVLPARSI